MQTVMSWGGMGWSGAGQRNVGVVTREPRIAVRGRNSLTLKVLKM